MKKEYSAPMLLGEGDGMGRVPPAVVLTAAAEGLVWGVSAALAVTGVTKIFKGKSLDMVIPALEPCIS